jgi:outer membrane receptor protein involved in Fe transport
LGNPNLQRTKISNADLRYEIYPRAGELFTLGVFYKYFDNPIEVYFNQSGAGTSSTFNFLNAEKAVGYGAELEFRKKLDMINLFKNFTLQGNFSYIHNRVSDSKSNIDRPMQGQSPYVINAGLQYDLNKKGFSTTLLFNQIGKRILYVGNDQIPAIWENPRPLLDWQIAQKILNNKGEIKFNVSDIFNRRAYFYHDIDKNEKFNMKKDAVAISRKYGSTFSVTFAYSIL